MESSSGEITELLLAWREGDERALGRLVPFVYKELHRLAHRYMAEERQDHTLQTTALVHEVFLRFVNVDRIGWQDRAHFFAISAQLMRRILVDYARSRKRAKRGGGIRSVSFEEALVSSDAPDLGTIDDALHKLARIDERKSRVVEMRFFGGLTVEETAEVLGVSHRTVKRDWDLAKAWLLRELKAHPEESVNN